MKNKYLLTILLTVAISYAQDFQVEVHKPYEFPVLPEGMTQEEFQIINRDLGWKELFTTIIFPGYSHYYVQEDSVADYIAFGRYIGASFSIGIAINAVFDPDINSSSLEELAESSSVQAGLFLTGIATNVILTIWDWGHANLVLKEKQEAILYTYREQQKQNWFNYFKQKHSKEKLDLPSIPGIDAKTN